MPPNQIENLPDNRIIKELRISENGTTVLRENNETAETTKIPADGEPKSDHEKQIPEKQEILWGSVIIFSILHLATLYGLAVTIFKMKILTMLWALLMGACAIFGVTGGVHRLWSHKTYKAKAPLKIILAFCYSIAAQYPPWDWVRDHRVHHKYSDTDADPHNSKRGLFYSHIGWLMQSKHPDMVRQEKLIDMSDVLQDRIFMTFTRYYPYFGTLFGFMMPIIVPMYFWNEAFECAVAAQFARYILSLNFTFSINSLAHAFGHKPYKKDIRPTDGVITSIITLGEGWHNYHHSFPWDYRAGELGSLKFNFTTTLLNCFAKIGWAYDMKAASKQMIEKVAKKHGDGSRSSEAHYPVDSSKE